MRLGKKQVLTVVKKVDFGVYLGNDEERVLLPKKQVPAGIEPGDPVEVFLYKDSRASFISFSTEPADSNFAIIVLCNSSNFLAVANSLLLIPISLYIISEIDVIAWYGSPEAK